MKFTKLALTIRNYAADETAAATVEFVLVAPVLFYMVFSVFETGWLMTKQTMMARGLHMAVRDLMIGNYTAGTPEEMHDDIKARICNKAMILKNCVNEMHLEMQVVSLDDGIPWTPPTCVDRVPETIEPVVFPVGVRGEDPDIMYIRACVLIDPMLPGTGFGAQMQHSSGGNGYQMVAFSGFMNEP